MLTANPNARKVEVVSSGQTYDVQRTNQQNKDTNDGVHNYFRCSSTPATTYRFDFCICTTPTGNCQISSISYMNNVLSQLRTPQGVARKDDVRAVLKAAYAICGYKPNIMLVDIPAQWCPNLEACFEPALIVHKIPYTSTNASNMCMYLIKVTDIL